MKYLVKISAVSDGARDRTTVCLNHKIVLLTTKTCRVPFSGEWWHAGCPEYKTGWVWVHTGQPLVTRLQANVTRKNKDFTQSLFPEYRA